MGPFEQSFTAEEETRAVLLTLIPKLPKAVADQMLSSPETLGALDIPVGDFVDLWGHRFHRASLFQCLCNLANGRQAVLHSVDGRLVIDKALLEEDGSATLTAGGQTARFVNVALLSENLENRGRALDLAVCDGEMAAEREVAWRTAIGFGPLDEELFVAFEQETGASPEAAFRRMGASIQDNQARFVDMVPLDINHYAGLFGLYPPSPSLAAYRANWASHARASDPVRLMRLLRLCGPLSILPGGLVASASVGLDQGQRLTLARDLADMPDPFSKVAAFEVACRDLSDPNLRGTAETLLSRILDRSDIMTQDGGLALMRLLALTTALTARNNVLSGWPLYARRLVRIVHASHLVRLFRDAEVDSVALEDKEMRSFGPAARLADLCDAHEAPTFQPQHFVPALIHALSVSRAFEALIELPEADRPAEWMEQIEAVLKCDVDAAWLPFFLSPSPLSECEDDWIGMIQLSEDDAVAALQSFHPTSDVQRGINCLYDIALARDVPETYREAFKDAVVGFLGRVGSPEFFVCAEILLACAARWRDIPFSDAIVTHLSDHAPSEGLSDPGSAPRLALLAAAAATDRAIYLDRMEDTLRNLAFILPAGPALANLVRGADLLGDFDPALMSRIATARSFAILALDRLPSLPHLEA